jgi:hypothetical protein
MSSGTHQETPPERARAELSTLNRMFETDLDKFRKASKDYDAHIDALTTSLQEKQKTIITNVKTALELSQARNQDIEQSLNEEKQRLAALTSERDKLMGELILQKSKLKMANAKLQWKQSKLERTEFQALRLRCEKQDLVKEKQDLVKENQDLVKEKQALQQKTSDAEHSQNRLRELSSTLAAIKERNVHLGAELELARRRPEDLRKRLEASEQQIVDLKADLRATTQRASTAEGEFKAFKSRFQQINDDMAALASSPGLELIVTQSVSFQPISTQPASSQPAPPQPASSTPAPVQHGNVEKRDSGLETDDSFTRSQPDRLDSSASNTTTMKASDHLRCQSVLDKVRDPKNWVYNRYFFRTRDLLCLTNQRANFGPMNLTTMKEKLAKDDYPSSSSFKADFDQIIADCRRLNDSRNLVCIAAEKLSNIFEQEWQKVPGSGNKPSGTASPTQGLGNRKRKAETDSLASSQSNKRSLVTPLRQNTGPVRPAVSDAGESLVTASPPAGQSNSNPQSTVQSDTDHAGVRGQLTTNLPITLDANVSTVAQLVSFAKSPSPITGHWKSLIPNEFELIGYAFRMHVDNRISDILQSNSRDMIVLRLMPAAETDETEFKRVFEHLHGKKSFARVSQVGTNAVEDIYLIPASKEHCYATYLSTLDFDLLPPTKTENVLLMAVVFKMTYEKQVQVRKVWDDRMMAIRNKENNSLVSMRHILTRNPFRISVFRKALVSSAERHLVEFSRLQYSDETASSEIQAYAQYVIRMSYRKILGRPIANGVMAPQWAFVLGGVVVDDMVKSTLVVDIQHEDRPLWLIGPRPKPNQSRAGRALTLLVAKFPSCLKEWDESIPVIGGGNVGSGICLRVVGLQMRRFRPPS